MKDFFSRIWRKIVEPDKLTTILVWIVAVVSCAGAITLAILSSSEVVLQALSYVCYGLAGLSLAHAVYTIVYHIGAIKQGVLSIVNRIEFFKKLSRQYGFRTVVFATIASLVSVAYVVLHIVLAFLTGYYFWYLSLATYYGLLVAMRGGIVLYQRKKGRTEQEDTLLQRKTEIRKYRTCGILLTAVPLCLTIPLLQIFYLDRAFVKDEIMVIAFAAYAFYKITMAILGEVNAKKQTDLTLRALRHISLADGLVAIFSLQTALLFSYGAGGGYAVANLATGSAVCLLTIALGIYAIVGAQKEKKKLQEEEKNGEV